MEYIEIVKEKIVEGLEGVGREFFVIDGESVFSRMFFDVVKNFECKSGEGYFVEYLFFEL